ncbi:methyl-accepting chemotaxis protein [Devosia epidermidihirudinis]|uniref:methyl-accepting chemotaxis protein n=1 Tax=Devosia epidermidihirudinis TaxID=1293439 RepID=UPI000697365B|nr:methyl-accepting chemotaxis protein [Devosia epidermidihirudinis]
MTFARLSIAGRIYASFAVIIVLLVLVTGLAVSGVQTLSGTLDGFRASTQDAMRVRSLTSALTSARLALSTYSAHPQDSAVAALVQGLSNLEGTAAAADVGTGMDGMISSYRQRAEAIIALDHEVALQLAGLDGAGLAATATLSAMIDHASQSANLNAKAAALAGLAMQNLLQLRLMVAQLVDNPVETALTSAVGMADATRTALGDLRGTFYRPDDLAGVDSVLLALDAYEVSARGVFGKLQERVSIGQDIVALEQAMVEAFGAELDSNQLAQMASEASATANARAVQAWVLVTGVVSLAIGLALAIAVAGWLSRTIRMLATATDQLAAGDFSVALPQAGASNELGRIARALEVFGANGIALQAEQEAKAIEVAAERTRQAELDRFQIALAHLAESAANGDFSVRLTGEFVMDDLVQVAGSINRLIETMERGLAETSSVLAALAAADLTHRVNGDYEGAFADLKQSTNGVASRLSEIMQDLRGTSHSLKSATEEILSGANDLAERTTRQALAVDETATAMQQVARSVEENAAKAHDANINASAVAQTASAGRSVMVEANAAMQAITDASSQISSIIRMIDDIAFQTNLLALNASVEAARAGEAGRGFAVVAVEVRRLAQSAASASGDVKALIEASAREVKNGSRLVAAATESLGNVHAAVSENSALLTQIATASSLQADEIQLAGRSISALDEMTQRNAALVEELNAAIEQTERQAAELDDVVKVFNVQRATPVGELRKLMGGRAA